MPRSVKKDDKMLITYLIARSAFLFPVISGFWFEVQDLNPLISNDRSPHEGYFVFLLELKLYPAAVAVLSLISVSTFTADLKRHATAEELNEHL